MKKKLIPVDFTFGVQKKLKSSIRKLDPVTVKDNLIESYCYINMSICFLKAGYLKRALQILDKVDHKELQTIKIYNATVMRLLEKPCNVMQAALNLSYVFSQLDRPMVHWLDTVQFKNGIQQLLLTLKKEAACEAMSLELKFNIDVEKLGRGEDKFSITSEAQN